MQKTEPAELNRLMVAESAGLYPEQWMQVAHICWELVNKMEAMHAQHQNREPRYRELHTFLPMNYRETLGYPTEDSDG